MTSRNYEPEEAVNEVDMSGAAIATRLKRVAQLRRLCLSLATAQPESNREKPAVDDVPEVNDSRPDATR